MRWTSEHKRPKGRRTKAKEGRTGWKGSCETDVTARGEPKKCTSVTEKVKEGNSREDREDQRDGNNISNEMQKKAPGTGAR